MLKEIQYLRVVAAMMVVIYHTFPQLKRMGYEGSDFAFMSAGVDIFFVISGFIMTYISYDRPQSAGTFLRDRFLRIAPLYWTLTCAIAVIGVIAPALLQSSVVRADHFIASMLFLPAPHPVLQDHLFPLLVPGWTLNYEMYFYLIFSFFVWMKTRYRYLFAIAAIATLTIIAAASPLDVVSRFYGNSIVLEFCFGIGLGLLYCNCGPNLTFSQGALISACVSLTGFALLIGLAMIDVHGSRAWKMGLPALFIVGGALIATRAEGQFHSSILGRIGDASYSLYLTHFVIMSALGQISLRIVGSEAPGWFYPIFVIYSAAICVAVSILVFERLELPLHKVLKRRVMLKRAIA